MDRPRTDCPPASLNFSFFVCKTEDTAGPHPHRLKEWTQREAPPGFQPRIPGVPGRPKGSCTSQVQRWVGSCPAGSLRCLPGPPSLGVRLGAFPAPWLMAPWLWLSPRGWLVPPLTQPLTLLRPGSRPGWEDLPPHSLSLEMPSALVAGAGMQLWAESQKPPGHRRRLACVKGQLSERPWRPGLPGAVQRALSPAGHGPWDAGLGDGRMGTGSLLQRLRVLGRVPEPLCVSAPCGLAVRTAWTGSSPQHMVFLVGGSRGAGERGGRWRGGAGKGGPWPLSSRRSSPVPHSQLL